MSNLNSTISSVGDIVSKCVGNNHLPIGPLPIISVVAALPVVPIVVVGGLVVYAARSLVGRLFD